MVEHEEALAPETADPLREILKDLGAIPSVETLLGNVIVQLTISSCIVKVEYEKLSQERIKKMSSMKHPNKN